ncbi:hypothetical protein [Croceicoccus ponticola]|uniref:hypothetical protein n=1 Tax=Croceicoccus ponticola TaxID=2217664 RepID=UPI0013E3E235|nr:hypothetical protein [Croceicoccus ponticola]
MSPITEIAIAVVFGTIGFYSAMVSFDSYRKSRMHKDLGLVVAGFFLVGLGVGVIIL